MRVERTAAGAAGTAGARWRRAGGAAALAIAAGYVATVALYAWVGAPPSTAEGWMAYLPGRTSAWWAIVALSVATDLLYLPVALALHDALAVGHRATMALAAALVGLFVALDLAVTWTNYTALLSLGGDYASAATGAARAADLAAARYPAAVLASRLEAVYAIGILSLAVLAIGLVMRGSRFGPLAAYLGVATGALGVLALSGWGVAVILNALCATAWLLVVGVRLALPGLRPATPTLGGGTGSGRPRGIAAEAARAG